MFYCTYLESDNHHEMYMVSLVNKIERLVLHHVMCVGEKINLSVPELISKTAPSYALGFKTTSSFIFNGKLNEIPLLVISMFSDPV